MQASLGFVAGLVLPVFAGYALVAYGDRDGRRGAATVFLRLGLSLGIGIGVSACAYFLTLFFVGPPGTVYRVGESVVLAAVGAFGWILGGQAFLPVSKRIETPDRQECLSSCGEKCRLAPWQKWLMWLFVVAVVLAVFGVVGRYWNYPLGDWDAWSIWNGRARFFFRAGDQWRQAFGPELPHTDYPLLLPCSNARLWSYLGADPSWTPWLLACLFTFAIVAVLVAGLCRLRGRSQGLLAGIVLLGSASFLREGTWQYADIPTAFFILASVLPLVLYDASERPPRRLSLLVLSGLAAGLAGWTKNEGLLFLAVLPTARGLITWRRDGVKQVIGEIGFWIAGALPVIAVIVLQKTCITCHNDLVGGQNWRATVSCLCDVSRHARVAENFLLVFARCTSPAFIVLPLLFLLLGRTKDRSRRAGGASTAFAVFSLMLAGYFLVCVTTPNNLDWQLYATRRLMMQVWPLGLLGVFLFLAAPEEAWKKEKTEQGDGVVSQ